MERRIDLSNLDLDRAAGLISERASTWSAWGLTVRPITWMDNGSGWPKPLVMDRSEVARPMSAGVQIEGSEEFVFAQIVLYAGGWADADYFPSGGNNIVCEYAELDDASELGPLLDRVVPQLRPSDEVSPRRDA